MVLDVFCNLRNPLAFIIQIHLHSRSDLIEKELYPGLDDANEQFIDSFDEMESQLDKEMKRLAELKDVMREDVGE